MQAWPAPASADAWAAAMQVTDSYEEDPAAMDRALKVRFWVSLAASVTAPCPAHDLQDLPSALPGMRGASAHTWAESC